MIELDDWILVINTEEHEALVGLIERVMVDSGLAVSACPLGYAPEIPITNSSRNATLRTASGAHIEHEGQKTVEYEHGDGGSVNVNFRVGGGRRVAEALKDSCDGTSRKLRHSRPSDRSHQAVELEHANGAYWMRLSRGEHMARRFWHLLKCGESVKTQKHRSRRQWRLRKEPGAVERPKHHGSFVTRGHRRSPRIECDFMFLTSRAREPQAVAAALRVTTASVYSAAILPGQCGHKGTIRG